MKKTSFTYLNYMCRLPSEHRHIKSPWRWIQMLAFVCLGAISTMGQVGPNCTHINASIGADDTARILVGELVTNSDQFTSLTVEILGSYGQRILYMEDVDGTYEIALHACPYIGRQLKVNVSVTGGSGGACWSYLTFKQANGPVILGRSKTVYCFDPLVSGGDIHGVPPQAMIPCRGTEDSEFVADWIDAFDCDPAALGTAGNDTAKIIYREYEAFSKDGTRGSGYDTIVVLRLPQITTENAFCVPRDTVYCGEGGKLGPYMVAGRAFDYGAGPIERYQALAFVESEFNPVTRQLEFKAAEFDPKCGISVHVDAWPLGQGDCSSQYKVNVEIKQTCWGTPGLYTLGATSATPYIESFHPKHWSYTRSDATGVVDALGTNLGTVSGFDGNLARANPLLKQVDASGATSYRLYSGLDDTKYARMCVSIPNEGDLTFTVSRLMSGTNRTAGYRLNGNYVDLPNGTYTLSLEPCDDFCFEDRGTDMTVSGIDFTETAVAAPLELVAPGYWRCEFWVIDLDTLPPVLECDLDAKASEDLVHGDTLYIPAGSHECAAHSYIPPALVEDDWSGVKYVKAIVPGVATVVLEPSSTVPHLFESHKQVKIPHGGSVPIYYEAYDSCHNIAYDTCWVKVKDYTKPVAVCDKGVIVGLSSKKVWVEASTFDEGSWDNCEINLLLARRADWWESCVDLCDDISRICYDDHDTIYCANLEEDKHVDEVEAHYYKTMKWLKEDGRECSEMLWNAWKYDLCKKGTLECVEHPYPVDEHYFKNLLKNLEGCSDAFEGAPITPANIDLWDQLGGGWSDAVPFDCEDACKEVMVELLAVDYWCNWSKCWTWVLVEDKTPIQVHREVDDRLDLSCAGYKADTYDYPDVLHPVSIEWIVDAAKEGDEVALGELDKLFGGYEKVWRDEYGNVPDATEGGYEDIECECDEFERKELTYDEHLGYVWKTIYYDSCWTKETETETLSGQIVVNCGQAIECEQTVWCNFDHCGQGYIFREWKFVPGCPDIADSQGNYHPSHRKDTITRKQLIWIGASCDLEKGMFTKPKDVMVNTCGIEYDDAGNATGVLSPEYTGQPEYLFDDDCRIVGISHQDKVFKIVGGDEACYKIIRTWYHIDWCYLGQKPENATFWWVDPEYAGRTISWEQKIIVIDTIPPVCSFAEELETVDAQGCAYTLDQTVTVDDSCGVKNYYFELFEVKGETKISKASGEGELDGSTNPSFNITVPDLLTGSYLLKVRVVDECQNESYCEDAFDVVTGKKPTAICITSLTAELTPMDLDQNGEVDTAMVTIWANEFDRSSAPSCGSDSELSYKIELLDGVDDTTFVEDADSLVLGCEHAGTQQIRMWVIQENGSFDYCDVILVVQNNMGGCGNVSSTSNSITGSIKTEVNESIKDVQVRATLENGQVLDYITTASGAYAFATALGQNVEITPTKDVDHLNGISTLDLVKIQKHLLGKEKLENEYREIASDVNNDGRISALDLVQLRKLILGKMERLPDNTSWRFFEKSSNKETYKINELSNAMQLHWMGVKVGDANASADSKRSAGRSANHLVFKVDDANMNAGSQYAVNFRAGQFKDIAGFQYTLQLDNHALKVVNVIPGEAINLTDENFAINRINEGLLTSSWNDAEGVSVDEDEILFTVIVEAIYATHLSEAMTINSKVTKAEAYNTSDEVSNVALTFANTLQAEDVFALFQNSPNPFTEVTSIGFNLPEADNAKLTVYDMTGKVIHVQSGDFAKGYNEVQIQKSDISVTGVLYYQLDTEAFTATRKMIHIR